MVDSFWSVQSFFILFVYVVLIALATVDIYRSDFVNGRKDKILFFILLILLTPISYLILSYGHKIQLSKKQKEFYNLIKNIVFCHTFLF